MQVAKNHALDNLRRHTRWHEKTEQIALERELSELPEVEVIFSDEEIKDDQLRMIFACCHPALTRESQVALTLKVLCGFNVEEIARAFLTNSETIAKRLTRARERLRTNAVPFEIPSGPELTRRLDSVFDVLYLLFNEGYNASHGEDLIRRDLCEEAVRLTTLLQETSGRRHTENTCTSCPALLSSCALFRAGRRRRRNSASARPGPRSMGRRDDRSGYVSFGARARRRDCLRIPSPGRYRRMPLLG